MAGPLDTSTDRTREYRKRQREHGGAQIGVVLQPGDDAKMWNRLSLDHGGPKGALVYLLRQEAGRGTAELTDAQLLAMLASRLRQAGGDTPPKKTARKSIRPQPNSDE